MYPLMTWPTRLAVRSLALQRLADAAEAMARIRAGADPEAVHDFRVALRRLDVLLRLYRPWLKDSVRKRRRRRLRDLTRQTGQARDLEVQQAWVQAHRPTTHDEAAALRDLATRLQQAVPPASDLEPILKACERQFRRLTGELQRYRVPPLKAPDDVPFAATTAALASRQLTEIRERLAGLAPRRDPRSIHALRLAAKGLRYLLEPAMPEFPDAATACRRLSRLQDLLGSMNDASLLSQKILRARCAATGVGPIILGPAPGEPEADSGPALSSESDGAAPPPVPPPDLHVGYVRLARRLGRQRGQLTLRLRRKWLERADALAEPASAVAALASADAGAGPAT